MTRFLACTGLKNGEKKLRGLIVRMPEWEQELSREVRALKYVSQHADERCALPDPRPFKSVSRHAPLANEDMPLLQGQLIRLLPVMPDTGSSYLS